MVSFLSNCCCANVYILLCSGGMLMFHNYDWHFYTNDNIKGFSLSSLAPLWTFTYAQEVSNFHTWLTFLITLKWICGFFSGHLLWMCDQWYDYTWYFVNLCTHIILFTAYTCYVSCQHTWLFVSSSHSWQSTFDCGCVYIFLCSNVFCVMFSVVHAVVYAFW